MLAYNYCLGFAFSENRKDVTLIRKTHPEWQAGHWNGIGGHIEAGESGSKAMAREFKEETGVLIPAGEWRDALTLHWPGGNVLVYRAFTDRIYEAWSVTDEFVNNYRVTELPPKVIPNMRWMLPYMLDDENIYAQVNIRAKK